MYSNLISIVVHMTLVLVLKLNMFILKWTCVVYIITFGMDNAEDCPYEKSNYIDSTGSLIW